MSCQRGDTLEIVLQRMVKLPILRIRVVVDLCSGTIGRSLFHHADGHGARLGHVLERTAPTAANRATP